MRILQVLRLLSPDGAYGGPARVALNQSAELIRRGHEVTIVAATRGYRVPPTELDGVPVKLFDARTLLPGTGFAGLGAPSMVRWFLAHRSEFDIVHIHLARDLVVMPIAIACRHRIPYVVQTHGMIVPSRHPLAGPLDAVWTRKLLRDAEALFCLTDLEREQISRVGRTKLPLVTLPNGVPEYPPADPPLGAPEVLFAARLHSRKRPLAFVEMAHGLLARGYDARFTLVGPDDGEGPAVLAALAGEPRISWEGPLPLSEIPRRLAAANVYVLPSVREPYPMSVLEAMSVGLPVVVSDDCGLASIIEKTNSGIVAQPTVEALTEAVGSILADPALASAMGARGRCTVQNEHGMRAIGELLLDVYSEIVDGIR